MAKRRGLMRTGNAFRQTSRPASRGSGGSGGAYLGSPDPTRYLVPTLIAPAAGTYPFSPGAYTIGYTVSARLNIITAASATGKVLARGISTGEAGFALWLDSGDVGYGSGVGGAETTYVTSFTDGQVVDIVLAANDTTAALYIDGSIVSTAQADLSLFNASFEAEQADGSSPWIPPALDVALTDASVSYPIKYFHNQLPVGFPA